MARRLKKLPSLSNVAKGSTATLEAPRGLSYHQIAIKYSGVELAQLQKIRMEVDGKVFQQYKDGEQLDALNKYYGRGAAENGFIVLHFARPELDTLAQKRLFALGTADISTLALRIDIDAAATAPVLEAYALEAEQEPFGLITKVKSFPVSFATGGTHEVDNLPVPASARIAAIHLFTDKVTHAELEVNGNIAFQAPKALEDKIQKDSGRTPTASKFTLDFIKEDDFAQSQVLAGIQDFRIRMDVGQAAAFDIVVEYLDGKNGL
ncbi:major capsid protein P2 [Vibrio europaeus]|uniref:major capsid protein P2 n=1 Tax=Vibrio europaeus TaxID=300876 RepID=UPI00234073FB|nr:major capsid protein P2 [Vibrio europaeus]MDC5840194.1 major capsid protein P2 [Vibrio europaeus]MDC5840213.1 major capsid protein P2 [Vibrio europaeus]MDC5842452.1 major capsid protein P2 [Vibrio europaeus]